MRLTVICSLPLYTRSMVDDKDILVSLKKGDVAAFDTMFKKYSSRLYFFSLKFFNNETDAKEIVQETFIKVWENRHRIDENQHFNTYLITIAKHIIYNHFRHKLVEQKYSSQVQQTAENFHSIEEDIILKNLRTQLLSGVEQLPSQQKEILRLKHKGYDNNEIAGRLNLSKRTVESHINKAFKFLRIYLDEHKEAYLMYIALVLSDFL